MNCTEIEVASRVLEGIEVDGSIARLAVPVASLDPAGIRFWIRSVLGDKALADRLERVPVQQYCGLLAQRRAQCERIVRNARFEAAVG